ncbi:MAG TPA: leucyl aminopeptidase [Myxococcota bacterium]|jgi:leucyl aminopeptidase
MQITVESGALESLSADVLALPFSELDPAKWRLPARFAALDAALGGRIADALRSGDFCGKRGEALTLHAPSGARAKRVLLLGTGADAKLELGALRDLAAAAVREGSARKGKRVALVAPSSRRVRPAALFQALAEGAVLGGYRFDAYLSSRKEKTPLERVALVLERAADKRVATAAAATGVVLAESQNVARRLSNEPPNKLPPAALAKEAERVAKEVGLRVQVWGKAELEKRGFGALLAVAQGSANEPRLIVLEHGAPSRAAKKGARRQPTLCVIGKGVCFDSGGLSLKPSTSMEKMKHDMSGGAAVIGVLRAAALLKLPLHVVGLIGAVENMPSGTAYRPDDIVTTLSGQTIMIANTDAEGRLVLADVLHHARTTYEPAAMIDLATLTGACSVALGTWAAAVLGNDQRLVQRVLAAGETTGERYWQLPLWDVHKDHMRGQIADVKQTGGRDGGTITAAAMLWHFVGETPWAHLDIAPVADTDKSSALQPYGATGFGVRSVVEVLRAWK